MVPKTCFLLDLLRKATYLSVSAAVNLENKQNRKTKRRFVTISVNVYP